MNCERGAIYRSDPAFATKAAGGPRDADTALDAVKAAMGSEHRTDKARFARQRVTDAVRCAKRRAARDATKSTSRSATPEGSCTAGSERCAVTTQASTTPIFEKWHTSFIVVPRCTPDYGLVQLKYGILILKVAASMVVVG